MAHIEILDSGRLDEDESAFPQAVQLPNGDILCSYSNAGGQSATIIPTHQLVVVRIGKYTGATEGARALGRTFDLLIPAG